MTTFVWAEDQNHQIGIDGHLPWNLPADLQHFKKLTLGHPLVMGRKTFMSLPQVLTSRIHVVLTTKQELVAKYEYNPQVIMLTSLSELNDWLKGHQKEHIYVIGGKSVFAALQIG